MTFKKYKKIDFENGDLNSYTSNQLKKVADYWFRKLLIKKAKKNIFGEIVCKIKKKTRPLHKLHVCHYIDRGKNIKLRYSEENCVLCCKNSNLYDSRVQVDGYKSLHHKDFEEYLGEEVVEKLKKESEERIIYYKQDFINLINELKEKVNNN